ncbi:MAG: hypothetical protein IPK60_03370 [Sandaracinaceae bacterium]|nr:hypothetical protein [Sandaracinaceae bacterium]
MRPLRYVAGVCAALLMTSCDQLGNPPRRSRTEAHPWQSGVLQLVTRTESIAVSRVQLLLAEHAGEEILGEPAPRDPEGVATLVSVVARVSPAIPPGTRLTIATTFRARDGSSVVRRWYGQPGDPTWLGLFYLPEAPVAAVTTLAQ